MYRFSFAVIAASFLVFAGRVADISAKQPTPAVGESPIERLPGNLWHILYQVDGSAVCCTADGVFLSVGDLHRWAAVRTLPRAGQKFRPVGGDRERFFLEDLAAGETPRPVEGFPGVSVVFCGIDYALNAVDADGSVTVVREKMSNSICAFASKNIGVIAWSDDMFEALALGPPGKPLSTQVRDHFLLTLDGGKTWKPVPSPVNGINCLLWVDTTRLLIATEEGSVKLFEHTGNGKFQRLWSADVRGLGNRMTLDDDYVWVGHAEMRRLKLSDGRVDATAKVTTADTASRGMAACHQCLLVWGESDTASLSHYGGDEFKSNEEAKAAFAKEATAIARAQKNMHLEIIARDPNLHYVRRTRIVTPSVAAILPLKRPLCLVITTDGNGLHLDLDNDKASPVALHVTPLPPNPSAAADPNLATAKQYRAMDDLARRIPQTDRFAILEAARKRMDLTDKQQVELATKQFRHYVESKKPGPVVDVPPIVAVPSAPGLCATADETRTMVDLGMQVPMAKRKAVLAEAAKNANCTERERVLWMTQEFRHFLEQKKLRHDEKNRSVREQGTEESSE